MKCVLLLIGLSCTFSSFALAEDMDSIRIASFYGTKQDTREVDERARAAHEKDMKDGGEGFMDYFVYGVGAGIGFNNFRGIPDGSWGGNDGVIGAVEGFIGVDLDWSSLGLQAGGSYGVYDWNGRGNTSAQNQTEVQQQGIITAAAYIGGSERKGLVAGFAYDIMLNARYGIFALDPLVDQMRLKIGYSFCGRNQIGAWGSYYVQTERKTFDGMNLVFRAINQVSAYYSHFFLNDSHITLWGGGTYGPSLMFDKDPPGRYLFGGEATVVLDKYWSITGYGSYMAPHIGTTLQDVSNNASNVGILVTFSIGEKGNRAAMTMGNNSNFLIDTNINE